MKRGTRNSKSFDLQKLGQSVMNWLTTPWKVTATAVAGLVIWYTRPILQTVAEEVLRAIENPNTEPDGWIKPVAEFAHRAMFVEIVVVCEIVLVGTIILLATKFAFYLATYIMNSLRKLPRARRTQQAQTQRPPQRQSRRAAKSSRPVSRPISGRILTLPEQPPDDHVA